MGSFRSIGLLQLTLALMPVGLHAQNLVADPGFEN
jgi:hypothetical protein